MLTGVASTTTSSSVTILALTGCTWAVQPTAAHEAQDTMTAVACEATHDGALKWCMYVVKSN
jgi:hypothetical protein